MVWLWADEWRFPELLTPTKVHAVPLQLTSERVRSSPTANATAFRFPMSMCGIAAQSDCLTCCLSAFSCSFMPRDKGGIGRTSKKVRAAQFGVVDVACRSGLRCTANKPQPPSFLVQWDLFCRIVSGPLRKTFLFYLNGCATLIK